MAIAAVDGGRPITYADFVMRREKTAIYVDGAAWHVGRNVRRDRAIRKALREAGRTVFDVTATEVARGLPEIAAKLTNR